MVVNLLEAAAINFAVVDRQPTPGHVMDVQPVVQQPCEIIVEKIALVTPVPRPMVSLFEVSDKSGSPFKHSWTESTLGLHLDAGFIFEQHF